MPLRQPPRPRNPRGGLVECPQRRLAGLKRECHVQAIRVVHFSLRVQGQREFDRAFGFERQLAGGEQARQDFGDLFLREAESRPQRAWLNVRNLSGRIRILHNADRLDVRHLVGSSLRFGTDIFAEHLLSTGLVGAQDIERARNAQVALGSSLPTALIRTGALSEAALLPILSGFTGIPLLTEGDDHPTTAAAESACKRLSASLSWFMERDAVPWERADGQIIIAARDPLQLDVRDLVRQRAGPDGVQWRYASQADMQSLQQRVTGGAFSAAGGDPTLQLRELAEEAPVIEYVNGLFARAVDERASDLHLEPTEHGFVIRLRVDGVLHDLHSMPRDQFDAVVSRIKLVAGLDIAERRLPQDGRLSTRAAGAEIDLRVSVIPSVHGESIVIRFLPKASGRVSIEKLGLEPDHLVLLRQWLDQPNGVVLVTGPTGSGKSTTLYAAIEITQDDARKVVTVEDPVEYQVRGTTQIQVQPDIGYTFAQALRAVLRHDPDVILVGEIRDQETASIAIQAALTGHLVLASLHTNDAAGAIPRLLDFGVEPFLLAATLRGVIAQRLVRRLCPKCAIGADETPLPEAWNPVRETLSRRGLTPQFKRGQGCSACGSTGFRGRFGIYEFLPVTDAVRSEIARLARGEGSEDSLTPHLQRSLLMDGLLKAAQGITTVDEVLRVAGFDEAAT